MLSMKPSALRAVLQRWAEWTCRFAVSKVSAALLRAATLVGCWVVGVERLMRLMLLVVEVVAGTGAATLGRK